MVFFALHHAYNDGSGNLDVGVASNYGTFIGGLVGPIFSLVGIFLIYENLLIVYQTIEIQQFESKLFELIRYHRENVFNMESKTQKGTMLFSVMEDNYENHVKYLNDIKPKDLPFTIEKLAFITFYFGLKKGKEILKNKNITVTELNGIEKFEKDKKEINTKGWQNKLNHYCSHVIETIKFIEKSQKIFGNDDKVNEYLNLYLAQISKYEFEILTLYLNHLDLKNQKYCNLLKSKKIALENQIL